MRILHAGNFGDGESFAGSKSAPHERSNPRGHLRQLVPLHGLSSDFRSRRSRNIKDCGTERLWNLIAGREEAIGRANAK